MADRTLNTGNNLYTNLVFALDGQSSAKDLKSGASSWNTPPTARDGNTAWGAMAALTLTLNQAISGPLSFYLKYKIESSVGSVAGPEVVFGTGVAVMQIGGGFSDEYKTFARTDAYDQISAYTGGAAGTSIHEVLYMIPAASGNPTLTNIDGTPVDTQNAAQNCPSVNPFVTFKMQGSADDELYIYQACLWSGRAVTWAEISANIGTLFQSESYTGGWVIVTH